MLKKSDQIKSFILRNVTEHPGDISAFTAKKFGVTRQAVLRHIRKLVEDGVLLGKGKTRATNYQLKKLLDESFQVSITPDLAEDIVWSEHLKPLLTDLKSNVFNICQHGFTEMLNNVIDHSEGSVSILSVERTALWVELVVQDDGVGIFNKIQKELGLADKRHTILELTKGKFTTDPERHTGEGIFFTSRMFDSFWIHSDELSLCHLEVSGDWLLEDHATPVPGTYVTMRIDVRSRRNIAAVFERFTTGEDYSFSRTHVPINLAQYGDEKLISRSQAKRVLARFEEFKEVFLDFAGVKTIGQAFADEIFRVFQRQHPEVQLVHVNANSAVKRMILRALSTASEKGHS